MKYCAATFISSSVIIWAKRVISPVLAFRGDDLRHRRMFFGVPVGRTIPIGDLRAGEREFRPRQGM